MARFKPNVPVTTDKPAIDVDTRGMAAGKYRFQLVVVDEKGQESAPATVTVTIGTDRLRPSDVIVSRPTDEAVDTKPNQPDKPGKPDKPKVPKTTKSARKPKGKIE